MPLTISALWTWQRGETTLGNATLLPVILSPAWLTAIAILAHNSGIVLLTQDAITLYRPWRKRRVPYDAIVEIKEDAPGLPPSLVVRGAKTTLRIPRSVGGYLDLYARLQHYTGITVPSAQQAPSNLPIQLRITPQGRRVMHVGALVLGLLYLGILILIVGTPIAQDEVPPYTIHNILNTAALAIFISALFIPSIVIFLLGIDPKAPVGLDITETEVRYRYRGKPWQIRPLEDLLAIAVQVQQKPTQTRIDGVTLYSKPLVSPLTLRFKDGTEVTFSPVRMWQFGYSRERLYTALAERLPDKEAIVEKT